MDLNTNEPNLAVFSTQLNALHEDVGEIKEALSKLTEAITKLALVEERQRQASFAIDRAFGTLERLETRITTVESEQNVSRSVENSTAKWVDRAVVFLVTAALMFVARKTGLM
jgi:hypothetical protein